MQIIVVGGGKVGYYLSKTLLEHGHRPHIIEKDRALCTRIADDLDVAVICGDKDPSSPPSVMTPIADAMTGTSADMTVIFDCGHFSAYEHPQAVADALLALVRRVQ